MDSMCTDTNRQRNKVSFERHHCLCFIVYAYKLRFASVPEARRKPDDDLFPSVNAVFVVDRKCEEIRSGDLTNI